jgi:hypothetical protein
MEPGGSLPHSQEPATCPYPKQAATTFPLNLSKSQTEIIPRSPLQMKQMPLEVWSGLS